MAKANLTAQQVRELLIYDSATGLFTWRERKWTPVKAGVVAGSPKDSGHIMIGINGARYAAHRLAWLVETGDWPKGHIDHINGVKTDNRIANLRDVSNAVNQQNLRSAKRTNRTGFLGVSRDGSTFRAQIRLGNSRSHIGNFKTAESAHAAYVEAKRRLHAGCTI